VKLWDALLSLDFYQAPRRSWERLGEAAAPFSLLLKPVGAIARHVNCERCGCNHQVVSESNAEKILAVCRCDEPTCSDMELSREAASLVVLDLKMLAVKLVDPLPLISRAERVRDTAAWHIGEATLRADGESIAVVACFSGNGSAMRNAALGVSREKLGRTVFVCKTGKPREIEALLPADSRAVGFDDMWTVDSDKFSTGKSARRLFAGWDDEPLLPGATAALVMGYIFERRGQKKAKVGNAPYDLPLWRCWMDGRSFDLPDIVGSELLVRILLKRGDTIYADELMRGLAGESVDISAIDDLEWIGKDEVQSGSTRFSPDARQELLGTKDIAKVQTKMRTLKAEIDECGDDQALARERAQLEADLDVLVEYISKNTRPGTNGTLLPKTFDDSLSSAGNLVGKHLRAVLKQLRGIDELLWSHLSNKNILRHGQACSYDAEAGYKWQKK
jgi:hypothetical protein